MEEKAHHGKQVNQKLKPYLVLQFLMKWTDESHVVSATEIVAYLENDCGIAAERRSASSMVHSSSMTKLALLISWISR